MHYIYVILTTFKNEKKKKWIFFLNAVSVSFWRFNSWAQFYWQHVQKEIQHKFISLAVYLNIFVCGYEDFNDKFMTSNLTEICILRNPVKQNLIHFLWKRPSEKYLTFRWRWIDKVWWLVSFIKYKPDIIFCTLINCL